MRTLHTQTRATVHPFIKCLAGILALSLASTTLAQDNRVTNPSFTDGIGGWDNDFGHLGLWDSRDAGGDPQSGSARVGNDEVGTGGIPTSMQQCIDITAEGGRTFEYGAHVMVESRGIEGATAWIGVRTFPTSDCTGDRNNAHDQSTGFFDDFEFDRWRLMKGTVEADAFDNSILFILGTQNPDGVGGQSEAFIDNVYLREEGFGHRLIDESQGGIYYNAGTPGQGLVVDISTQINLFFAGWYTWTTVPGEYDWMTLQGGFRGSKAELIIFRSSGGVFNDPAPVSTEPVGSAEFLFDNCTDAELHILFDGEQQSTQIDLIRLGPAPLDCVD